MTLQKSIKAGDFNEDVVIEISLCRDIDLILSALKRRDCPPALLIMFANSPYKKLRLAVAKHKNTPKVVRERLISDSDRDVVKAARGAKE